MSQSGECFDYSKVSCSACLVHRLRGLLLSTHAHLYSTGVLKGPRTVTRDQSKFTLVYLCGTGAEVVSSNTQAGWVSKGRMVAFVVT